MEFQKSPNSNKSYSEDEQEAVDNYKSSSDEEGDVSSGDEYVPVRKPRVIPHFEMEEVGGLYLPPVLHFQPDIHFVYIMYVFTSDVGNLWFFTPFAKSENAF